jgi:hypothetical protein
MAFGIIVTIVRLFTFLVTTAWRVSSWFAVFRLGMIMVTEGRRKT